MIKNLYGNAVGSDMKEGNIIVSGTMAFASGETIEPDVLDLPADSVFELVTVEVNASTGAYRGARKILIVTPSAELYGSEACHRVVEAESTNSGVTITYNSDSTIDIKPSSTTYRVEYQVTQIM